MPKEYDLKGAEEIQQFLNISLATIIDWIVKHKMPVDRIGARLYSNKADIQAWRDGIIKKAKEPDESLSEKTERSPDPQEKAEPKPKKRRYRRTKKNKGE